MKAVIYTPKGVQRGSLTTQVGNGFVTLLPGVNHVDDKVLPGLEKNCKQQFKDGVLAVSAKEAAKEVKAVAKAEAKVAKAAKVAKDGKKAKKKASKKKASKKNSKKS